MTASIPGKLSSRGSQSVEQRGSDWERIIVKVRRINKEEVKSRGVCFSHQSGVIHDQSPPPTIPSENGKKPRE
jgi:hypothetical protein